jgi:hypothetical protein
MDKKVWLIALGLVSIFPILAYASSLGVRIIEQSDIENLDGYNIETLKREDGKNLTIAIPENVTYKKITIEDQQERKQ